MEIYTRDLRLKTVDENDAGEVARTWRGEKGEIPLSEALEVIAGMKANHEKNRPGHIYHLCLAVLEKKTNTVIGWCGLDGTSGEQLHIFYSIVPAFRLRGYASQCAEGLLRYAFEEAKVPFVNGGCYKSNAASYRVMEKAGMKQSGFEENGDPLFYMDRVMYLENQRRKKE